MGRITRNELEQIVTLLNNQTEHRFDFTLGKQLGGYRLEANGGSRDVSPRLPAAQMYYWLHAFEAGVDHAVKSGYRAPTTATAH